MFNSSRTLIHWLTRTLGTVCVSLSIMILNLNGVYFNATVELITRVAINVLAWPSSVSDAVR